MNVSIVERLEYLRGEIQAERISYDELAELADLAEYIEPGDVELLQWAGVPEFPEGRDGSSMVPAFTLRPGDLVDLAGDPRASQDPADQLRYSCLYAQVESITQETEDCIRVDFVEDGSIGYSPNDRVAFAGEGSLGF